MTTYTDIINELKNPNNPNNPLKTTNTLLDKFIKLLEPQQTDNLIDLIETQINNWNEEMTNKSTSLLIFPDNYQLESLLYEHYSKIYCHHNKTPFFNRYLGFIVNHIKTIKSNVETFIRLIGKDAIVLITGQYNTLTFHLDKIDFTFDASRKKYEKHLQYILAYLDKMILQMDNAKTLWDLESPINCFLTLPRNIVTLNAVDKPYQINSSTIATKLGELVTYLNESMLIYKHDVPDELKTLIDAKKTFLKADHAHNRILYYRLRKEKIN